MPPSRNLRTGLLAVVVLATALAGCFGKGNDAGSDDVIDPAGTPTFGAETGAIRGLLVSDEEVPIVGAQVGLQPNLDLRTITDVNGAFVFSDLAPGTYTIEAQAIGYDKRLQQVEVTAGNVAEPTIKLVPAPISGLSYSVTYGPIPGKFFCAFGAGNAEAEAGLAGPCKGVSVGGPLQPAEDGYQQVAQGEENIFLFPTSIIDNMTGEDDVFRSLVLEVQWVPATSAATMLQAAVERYQPDGRDFTADDYFVYGETSGTSPLRLLAHGGETNAGGDGEMPADVAGFQVGVFPTFAETPQVFTEQRFDLWLTLFYNQPAPDAFTVLEEA